MSLRYNKNHSPLVKIVYLKVEKNGKVELIPMELYADNTLQRCA